MSRIYLDANATTPLLPEVFEAMRPFLLGEFGNPSSIHQQGQRARAALERARQSVARLLSCSAGEIVFTSGGTESDNLALCGTLEAGDHLITTQVEHHAVLHTAEALEKRGVQVTYLPCTPSGLVTVESLDRAFQPNTRLVSVIFANNETGTIQPIAELAALAKSHGALFHTDAVQAGGKLPLDLSGGGGATTLSLAEVDLLSIAGHKMYAPQGTGALYVRSKVRLAPMFHGGTHERQRRAGTENVAGIVAFGRAAELAREWLAASPNGPGSGADSGSANPMALAALRDRLEQALLRSIPLSGVNGAGCERTPNTANLFFDHVEAEALLISLDLQGISVSGGSACQSGAAEPSHVLTAMGLAPARARASIRFSLSRQTTPAEIEQVVKTVPEAVAWLRSLSPQWKQAQATVGAGSL